MKSATTRAGIPEFFEGKRGKEWGYEANTSVSKA
jgi:hypothetical protein